MISSPPDILMIAPTPFFENRGCHLRIREEAESLQRAGCSILIAAFRQGNEVKNLRIERSSLDLINFDKGPTASWKKIPASFFLFLTTLRLVFKYRPKAIYCHLLEGLSIGIVTLSVVRIFSLWTYKPILIFDSQGSRADEMKSYGMIENSTILNFFRGLEKFLLRFPDKIFVSSINYLKKIKEMPGLKDRTEQLADGPSFSPGKDIVRREEKIKNLKKINHCFEKNDYQRVNKWLEEEKFIIIYTGNFGPAKGLPDFIRQILPHFSKKDSIRFIFAGEGDLKTKNEEIAVYSSKLEIENLPLLLSLADIGLDPKPKTSTESSGKLINYMAAGLPVLAIKSPNSLYFVGDERQLVNRFKELKTAIAKLAKNKRELEMMGKKNLQRVKEKFSWDLQIRKILAIIGHRSI